jgi:hypothetical protein
MEFSPVEDASGSIVQHRRRVNRERFNRLGSITLVRDAAEGVFGVSGATPVRSPQPRMPLAAIGVFAEQDDGRFALTPMGEYLARPLPLSW